MATQFLQHAAFEAPEWASGLTLIPKKRVQLAMTPTPVHRWHLPDLPGGVEVYVKRDDLTGCQLSGNKVRKLEFLLADAVDQGADCVITIGGIQSNHCRATAVAARYLGLDTHLILRNSRLEADLDPKLVGNLLPERLIGAHVHQVTKEEYAAIGSEALTAQLARELVAQGRKPYIVPVGGSNALGSWGYLMAVEEMRAELDRLQITDIASACGSGATSGGLALGAHLAGLGCGVQAYIVCDSEAYFHDFIQGHMDALGAAGASAADLLDVTQCKGAGYAMSRDDELEYMTRVAVETGVVLDPVYTGKAVTGMVRRMQADPGAWQGRRVLFVHTGGLLGVYDKADQLQGFVEGLGRHSRMKVEGLPAD